jgi:hypothetical protein
MKNLCVVAMLTATLAGGTVESASAEPASKAAVKAFRGRLRGGHSGGGVPLHGHIAGADLYRLVHP